jgi:hypothetical protein
MIPRARPAFSALPARLASALLLAACGPGPGPSTPAAGASSAVVPPPEPPGIAAIWKKQCATCHSLVQPGTHDRESLTAALVPHRSRVKLREEQWGEMVDFLARK